MKICNYFNKQRRGKQHSTFFVCMCVFDSFLPSSVFVCVEGACVFARCERSKRSRVYCKKRPCQKNIGLITVHTGNVLNVHTGTSEKRQTEPTPTSPNKNDDIPVWCVWCAWCCVRTVSPTVHNGSCFSHVVIFRFPVSLLLSCVCLAYSLHKFTCRAAMAQHFHTSLNVNIYDTLLYDYFGFFMNSHPRYPSTGHFTTTTPLPPLSSSPLSPSPLSLPHIPQHTRSRTPTHPPHHPHHPHQLPSLAPPCHLHTRGATFRIFPSARSQDSGPFCCHVRIFLWQKRHRVGMSFLNKK